jgi:amidase
MYMDPSLVPHRPNGQPNIRNLGPAASSGTGKYKQDLYLRERGDTNIRSTADLIAKSNFFTDVRAGSGFSDKKASLESTNNAVALDNVNELARHYVLQMITLQCFGQLNLDAVVFPTQNIPAPKLGAPTEPTVNDRGQLSWNLLPGSASFPVISVPAAFTTEVYDRVPDPSSPDGTRLVGPTPAKLPRGLTILAKPFDEPTLFKIASAYEAATHHRTPPPGFGSLDR